MRKFIFVIAAVFMLNAVPSFNAIAAPISKQYSAQIKEMKRAVKENASSLKKMEAKIDDKNEELSKVLVFLFDREMPPAEDLLVKLEEKQEELVNTAQLLLRSERTIKKLKVQANENMNTQNYAGAVDSYNKIIETQKRQMRLLDSYSNTMQEFINLLKSIQYK